MTVIQYITVFALALGSWGALCWAMQKRATPLRVLVAFACLFAMGAAFSLGSYWSHIDYTCKPNQHCFPWGN